MRDIDARGHLSLSDSGPKPDPEPDPKPDPNPKPDPIQEHPEASKALLDSLGDIVIEYLSAQVRAWG